MICVCLYVRIHTKAFVCVRVRTNQPLNTHEIKQNPIFTEGGKNLTSFCEKTYIGLINLKYMVNSRNYPIGIQYFTQFIETNAIYVDKAQFIVPLVDKARPLKTFGIIYFVVQTFGKFLTFQKLCENRSILSHFYSLYHKVDNSENFYLTGQDIVTAGVGAALFSSVLTASAMTGVDVMKR
jgi:hypothetical protein